MKWRVQEIEIVVTQRIVLSLIRYFPHLELFGIWKPKRSSSCKFVQQVDAKQLLTQNRYVHNFAYTYIYASGSAILSTQ